MTVNLANDTHCFCVVDNFSPPPLQQFDKWKPSSQLKEKSSPSPVILSEATHRSHKKGPEFTEMLSSLKEDTIHFKLLAPEFHI